MSKICKFGPHLKELRIHLCQTGAASKGVRDFIKKYYIDIKIANPKFPVLIRECSGVQPRLWARYGKFRLAQQLRNTLNSPMLLERGKESSVSLTNLEASDVLRQLEGLTRKV